MGCNCGGTKPPVVPTDRTVFQVTYLDGTTAEFANFAPAQRERAEHPGSALGSVVVPISE